MDQNATLISWDVDFDSPGFQSGHLRVPYSSNRSAYGYIPIPIAVIQNGPGPTVLLSGGIHGDEYEGPIALSEFLQTVDPSQVCGRIIVLPSANYPAYLAGTRVSPIDGVNLNRCFPGNRTGTVTEMIGHMLESVLLPKVDFALDFHAGGSSLDYLPTLFTEAPANAADREELGRLIAAFAPKRVAIMNTLGEDRIFRRAAGRAGVRFFLDGEFGGTGSVNLDGLAMARRGIAGVLNETGVLPSGDLPAVGGPTEWYAVKGREHYAFASCDGIFEPRFRLGDRIEPGQLAGVIHRPDRPWEAPELVHFAGSGLAICIRNYALVKAGDCLGHLVSEIDPAEIVGPV